MSDGTDWTKKAAIFISLVALAASATSAFAAWNSWQTARASLAISDRSLDLYEQNMLYSGALVRPRNLVIFEGGCGSDGAAISAEVTVANRGQTATNVSSVQFGVIRAGFPSSLVGDENASSAWDSWEGERPVEGLTSEVFELSLDCDALRAASLPTDATALASGVNGYGVWAHCSVLAEDSEDPTDASFMSAEAR